MRKTRFYISSPRRGSNALAALSCALALLAAYPLADQAVRSAPPPAVTVQGSAASEGCPRRAAQVAMNTASVRATRPATMARLGVAVAATRRPSHVLATLERLGRFLAGELTCPLAHTVAVDFAQPVLNSPRIAALPAVRLNEPADLPPPMERCFALRHSLLAPPV